MSINFNKIRHYVRPQPKIKKCVVCRAKFTAKRERSKVCGPFCKIRRQVQLAKRRKKRLAQQNRIFVKYDAWTIEDAAAQSKAIGQFKSGQSGNPTGKPKEQVDTVSYPPASRDIKAKNAGDNQHRRTVRMIPCEPSRDHKAEHSRSTVAVEALPHFEREAKQRQGSREDIVEKIPECQKGRARDKAGSMFNVNPRYVEDAKKIKRESPKLFEQVKRGETTISEARRQPRVIKSTLP